MGLNEEQTMLVDAVRHFLEGELADGVATAPLGAQRTRRLWRQCVEMGWLQACVPEADDGLALGLADAALMVEEMGRRLLPLPVADAMALKGYLPGVVAPVAPLDAEASLGRLENWLNGDEYMAIASDGKDDAGIATYVISEAAALRLAWDDDRLTLSAHAVDHAGHGIDPLVATGRLVKHGVACWQVEHACPERVWTRFCQARRCLRLAELLGVGAQSLSLAAAYACEREQFGKPIGANQAVKHKLADNWMALDNARLLLHEACELVDQDSKDALTSVLMAELLTIEAATTAAGQAIQTFGAMGITWECPVHFYLKRARHLSAYLRREGDATFILDRLWDLGGV